jgi:broad specificity phosphatase PhoE
MLLVIRHALSVWNMPPARCQGQLDIPLSEQGMADARSRAADLGIIPAATYSSHLRRARRTSELITTELSRSRHLEIPPVVTDQRLAEAHCGRWQGRLHEDIRREDPKGWAALAAEEVDFAFPGGERLEQVHSRFCEAIEELSGKHRGEEALVVTHGGPIRLYLTRLGLVDPSGPGSRPGNLEGFLLDDEGRSELVFRARVD